MLEVFYSRADSFTVGLLTSIHLSARLSQDEEREVTFEVKPSIVDKYGDSLAEAKILIHEEALFPAIKLRPRNAQGKVGFDTPEAGKLCPLLFKDATLITNKFESLVYQPSPSELLSRNLDFLSMRGSLPAPIMCTQLKESFRGYLENNIESLQSREGAPKALIGLLDHCKAIFVWSFANGTNPVALSLHMPEIISDWNNLSDTGGFKLTRVSSENSLPSW